jgi:uncharacterized glyoxalase superfamily protein PhnB
LKKRTAEPWLAADAYGRSLPVFTVNLIVADVERSVAFYREVLEATVVHFDADFAALRLSGVDFMLHADHTYEEHPWHGRLAAGERRGLGAELRAFGLDPDAIEARGRENGATIVQPAADKPHGWREAMVADPDGYVWAVGRAIGG